MADAKAEADWAAALKAVTTEVTEDKEEEATVAPRTDVVVGSEEENLLAEAVIATINRQLPEVCKHDSEVPWLSLVFLRFRGYAVVDAVARLGRFLQWRAKYGCNKPETLTPELREMLTDGARVLLPGTDKEGRSVLVLNMKHMRVRDPKLMMQTVHWVTMKVMRRGPDMQKKGLTMIMDMEGGTFKNMDPGFMKEMGPAMRKCFPTRTAHAFILNPTTLADVVIPVFKALNSEKVGSRIQIVRDLAELHKYVDKAQLPPQFGGTLQFDMKAWVESQK
jgi:hypothetical protein